MSARPAEIVPLTPDRWPDVAALFGEDIVYVMCRPGDTVFRRG